MDGDFLGDSFLGEKLKELFFFAGAVATPPRATSQAWAAAWPLAWAGAAAANARTGGEAPILRVAKPLIFASTFLFGLALGRILEIKLGHKRSFVQTAVQK